MVSWGVSGAGVLRGGGVLSPPRGCCSFARVRFHDKDGMG